MTVEERRKATYAVLEWIEEYRGRFVAEWLAMERTPMPIELPLDEQLDEGVRIALGEVLVGG